MTRNKVKLEFIANDSARRAAFRKRRKGLMKKADELTKLCGVEACGILYGPNETQPDLWPSPLGVQSVLQRFRAMPHMEQTRKMMNQESFTRERVIKTYEQLMKQIKDNKEKRMTMTMYEYLCEEKFQHKKMDLVDLDEMGAMLDQKLKNITGRMEALDKAESESQAQVTV